MIRIKRLLIHFIPLYNDVANTLSCLHMPSAADTALINQPVINKDKRRTIEVFFNFLHFYSHIMYFKNSTLILKPH